MTRDEELNGFLARVAERTEQLRELRDDSGWPEPGTVEELRRDPRLVLRNSIPDDPERENLVLAAALATLVAVYPT